MASLLNRVSLIAIAAAALAASVDARAQSNPIPAEAAPSQALPPVNRRPTTNDTDDIEAAPLPRPNPAPVQTPPPPIPTAVPTYDQQTPPPPPMATMAAPKAKVVAKRVVKPAPPPPPPMILSVKGAVKPAKEKTHTIKVDDGDTVNNLSARFLTPKATLLKVNKIKKPFEVDVGQSIKIPTPKAYIVESGDTLFAIAKRFTAPADVLAELNNIGIDERVRPGQQIALPAGVKDTGPLKHPAPVAAHDRQSGTLRPTIEPTDETAEPPVRDTTPSKHVKPPVRGAPPPIQTMPPVVESSPAPNDSQVAMAGRGRFVWPVRGDTLSSFGAKPGGQRNDGLDIAAPVGTSVKASAGGDVVYAGNQVPGFGNLVLIKHPGGWVTAYAHLSRTEVKIRDHVEQGDEIGEVGQTGGVDLPELHFEIRYAPTAKDKAKPIDPALVLAPAG